MKKLLTSFVVALMFILPFTSSAFAMQNYTSNNTKGLDVSHWQGTISWSKVKKAGYLFTYIKAGGTSGNPTYVDPMFKTNVANAHAAGLSVGAYFYADPTAPYKPLEAEQQAMNFVNIMKGTMPYGYGDIQPVLDFEISGGLTGTEQAEWVREFVNTVEGQTGRQAMIYTANYYMDNNGDFGGNGALSDLPLWDSWLIRYTPNTPIPPNDGGWSTWTVWQYTDQGAVSGITGYVDLDHGPADLTTLRGYLTSQQQLTASNAALAALN